MLGQADGAQRDLVRLSLMFPLSSDDPHKPAGWQWTGRDGLDIPALDAASALALVLADAYLAALLPPASRGQLAAQAARARHVLDALDSSGLGCWADKVRVLGRGPRLQAPAVDEATAACVYAALLEGCRLEGRYRPRSQQRASRYEVNPLGLVARDGVLYLVATLWDYGDVKQFALHRFTRATLLEKPVTVPAGFSLDAYIASGEFDYPRHPGRQVRLRLRMDAATVRHLEERWLGADQRIGAPRAGRVLVSATVQDTGELRWWLLGFGAQVEVLAPAALRREMAEQARQLAGLYAR